MIDLSSNLITAGMIPLMLAFAIDVYVVILAAAGSTKIGSCGDIVTVCTLAGLWFLFPLVKKSRE